MSGFEIFLIVLVCLTPVFALIMILPKTLLKKQKKEKPADVPVKTYEEIKKEEAPKEIPKVESTTPAFNTKDFTAEDFKGYLKERKNGSKPQRIELPKDFQDTTMPYMPRRRRRVDDKPKSISEEIHSLSPELKAMLISGVLDKKNYDEDI